MANSVNFLLFPTHNHKSIQPEPDITGSSIWNIVATALKMPISGTHSIVGATIGFSVVLRGWESIRWKDMIRVVASWFASPLLSGFISSIIYIIISKTIISKVDPLRYGLKALPLFYGATIFINVASIVIDGPEGELAFRLRTANTGLRKSTL